MAAVAGAAAAAEPPPQNPDDIFSGMTDKDVVNRSLRSYKGYVTRAEDEVERCKVIADRSANEMIMQELQAALKKYLWYISVLESGYARLQVLDPEQFSTYTTKIDTYVTQRNAIREDVHRVIANSRVAAAPAIGALPAAAGAGAAGAGGAAAPSRIKPVETLKPRELNLGYSPEEMRVWAGQFKAFYRASQLGAGSIAEQQAYLFVCLDRQLASRVRDEIEADTPVIGAEGSCMSVIEREFLLRYPLFLRRLKFFMFQQAKNQLFSDFATKLRKIGDEAELGGIGIDELYVYKYICSTCDEELREKFLEVENPKWEDLKKVYRAYEQALGALKELKRTAGANESKKSNNNNNSSDSRRGRSKSRGPDDRGKKKGRPCFRCGQTGHTPWQCPRKDDPCFYCEKKGHLAPMCRKKKKDARQNDGGGSERRSRADIRPPRGSSPRRSPSPDRRRSPSRGSSAKSVSNVTRLVEVPRRGSQPTPDLLVQFSTGRKQFEVLVTPDTGSTRSIFPKSLLDENKIPFKWVDNEFLFAADGKEMACEGVFTCWASCHGREQVPLDAIVSSAVSQVLLAWHDLIALGVIPADFPNTGSDSTNLARSMEKPASQEVLDSIRSELTNKYAGVVRDSLGEQVLQGPPMKIYLRDDVKVEPKKVLTARQVPRHREEKAKALVKKMASSKVIAPVSRPTRFISASHFVDKPNGDVRLTTDYKQTLNPFVRRPVHPFPTTEEVLQQVLPSSRYFAKLDAVQGYFQIALDEESSYLTTFLTPWGRFRYLRAPMGLSASSDEWCHRSAQALEGLTGVLKLVHGG